MRPARRPAGASFGAARRFFLLVFRAGAFALSFPARQRVSYRHSRHCTGGLSDHQYILAADSHGLADGKQGGPRKCRPIAHEPRKTPGGRVDRQTSSAPRRPSLEQMKGREVTSADEAADPSAQTAGQPAAGEGGVRNTSDSSGLRADDRARGVQVKEKLRPRDGVRRRHCDSRAGGAPGAAADHARHGYSLSAPTHCHPPTTRRK